MTLHLVRHGRPLVDRAVPAHEWTLDPAAYDDVWALRDRLPSGASWYTSPEPKAVETAQLLTDAPVGIVDGLREHVRDGAWVDDLEDAVRRAFRHPDVPAEPGWEPLATCRGRVVATVGSVLAAHPGEDVVLVGHGTAWTVVVAALTDAPPDLDRWTRLAMPDVILVDRP
ncbi:histidine phosphatase family protein [Nocardioides sp.]|uniref:histidine phosphatase family protein n=1 Tax=Nocardioides sp. TaxID=35761 RepID=UPI0027211C2C|nr:histidine phosphatase family protein [Nocardioides sp.]MDO9457994.1 histidine phosphatase family protein [Nocardioides sp.]